MSEAYNNTQYAKGNPKRLAIAERLREMRRIDRIHGYHMDRSGRDYIEHFLGLESLFEYLGTLTSKIVLDVGAGTTRGIAELSTSALGQNLSFQATVLSVDNHVKSNLGLHKIHVTSAEVLRGIPERSIGCVLALNSITYSAAPQQAVERINEVLVPGGIFKATVEGDGRLKRFTEVLKSLAYDLATICNELKEDIVLAIKPGRSNSSEEHLAETLLSRDWYTYRQQAAKIDFCASQ